MCIVASILPNSSIHSIPKGSLSSFEYDNTPRPFNQHCGSGNNLGPESLDGIVTTTAGQASREIIGPVESQNLSEPDTSPKPYTSHAELLNSKLPDSSA